MSRASLGRIALVLCSLLLVFGLGELVARGVSRMRPRPAPPLERSPLPPDLPLLKGLVDLAGPNVLGIHRGVVYRTNSRGLRGPERTERPADDVVRIAIAGDSVTVGWGVDEEDTYASRLEAILNAEGGGRRFEVVNLGLAGVDAATVARRLKIHDAAYHPRLLVYGFTVNDIEGPHYERFARRRPAKQLRFRRSAESPSHLLRWIESGVEAVREVHLRGDTAAHAEIVHNYLDNPAAWQDFSAALDAIAALADQGSRCAHVLVHTHLTHLGLLHPYAPVYDLVEEAARARGFGVTQTLSAYRFRSERALWVSRIDPHPNREAHRILARELADDLLALPAACFAPRDSH